MEADKAALLKEQIDGMIGPAGTCALQEPMSGHTTFRVGGPAAVYVTLEHAADFAPLVALVSYLGSQEIPFFVIGRGSNLLVSDAGYEGVIIDLSGSYQQVNVQGTLLSVQAGATLAMVARAALKAGLTGFEFAAGIPGTMGGAVVMNAGAYGGEIRDVIQSARVLAWKNQEPEILTLSRDELDLSYRHSRVMDRLEIVLDVVLQLQPGEPEAIQERMEDLRKKRLDKQPLEYPSAGSTFKRPEGYFAGKLIMDAGLAGYRVGGAMVSPKHCGFVINYDRATAGDIYRLCRDVQQRVWDQFQVKLEPEVRMIGIFD